MISVVAYRENSLDNCNSDLIITDYITYEEAIDGTAKSYDYDYDYYIFPKDDHFYWRS